MVANRFSRGGRNVSISSHRHWGSVRIWLSGGLGEKHWRRLRRWVSARHCGRPALWCDTCERKFSHQRDIARLCTTLPLDRPAIGRHDLARPCGRSGPPRCALLTSAPPVHSFRCSVATARLGHLDNPSRISYCRSVLTPFVAITSWSLHTIARIPPRLWPNRRTA
jgi:hypothetical protein